MSENMNKPLITKKESVYAIDVYTGETITKDKPYEICPRGHYNYIEVLKEFDRKCMSETCEYYNRPYKAKNLWDRIFSRTNKK